ncbi:MAG: hypothetical protein JJV95_01715 [Sulfurospirillum sp.]|nr:hypothetical protein [Sulfurospirillum sp.]MBL0702688.1 hypothetical protein [Sulfurospirillum sp.]
MSEIYSNFLKTIVDYQYELNSYISKTIRSVDGENSFYLSLLVLLIAFIYGAVHAAGPGHGKALVAFYFSTNKSSYRSAFKMGYMISIIHALSALCATFGIFFILKAMFRENFNNISSITMQISASMIILIGIYLMYDAFKHKNLDEKKIKSKPKSQFIVALSSGIVPCPGVMTIVLFCIILEKYILGVSAAIAMSIGMGFTISLAGIFSISLNKRFGGLLGSKAYLLKVFGALIIFSLGLFLLLPYL